MADNVTIDNGTLTDYTASTDEGAGGHVQRVKLAYSADGSEVHVPADVDGLLVNLGANNDVTVTNSVGAASDKVEDNAHSSADTGKFVLGVRNDSAVARTGSDGDYSPLSTDSAP